MLYSHQGHKTPEHFALFYYTYFTMIHSLFFINNSGYVERHQHLFFSWLTIWFHLINPYLTVTSSLRSTGRASSIVQYVITSWTHSGRATTMPTSAQSSPRRTTTWSRFTDRASSSLPSPLRRFRLFLWLSFSTVWWTTSSTTSMTAPSRHSKSISSSCTSFLMRCSITDFHSPPSQTFSRSWSSRQTSWEQSPIPFPDETSWSKLL